MDIFEFEIEEDHFRGYFHLCGIVYLLNDIVFDVINIDPPKLYFDGNWLAIRMWDLNPDSG